MKRGYAVALGLILAGSAVVVLIAVGVALLDASARAEYAACLDRNAWLESGQALRDMCSGYLR